MLELLLPPLIAGLAIAAAAGPLGCFLVWRRMAFFGDTLAHGALLGVALGALAHINPTLAILGTSVLLAAGLTWLARGRDLGNDTLLGVLAHTALAFGIIAVTLIDGLRPDLLAWLFGDLLGINATMAATIGGGAVVALALLVLVWRRLLAATVDEDIARIEGVDTALIRFLLVIALAIIVALSMRVVGLLLVTALLLVPAAAARRFARDPEPMALLAAAIGMTSVIGGMTASWWFDIPAGPAVVATATALFMATRLVPMRS
ncbi:MAG: iron chelate uptake ABC transporter family permease subunit [Pseudomonadota bacterium]